MTKKQIIRCIAFMLSVLMLLVVMCDLFETENTKNFDKNMYTYRNLPEDTVDAVFVGTSGFDRFWIGAKAFEENGLSTYPVAYEAFPAWLYTDVIDEVLSLQNPQLIIIDIRAFSQSNTKDKVMEVRARKYMDSLPFFSVSRIKTAFKTMAYLKEVNPERESFDASLLFSFIKYHSKWSDNYSLYNNLGSKEQEYGGFYLFEKKSIRKRKQKEVIYNADKFEKLDPVSERALYELIDYIKEKELDVLFVDTPQVLNKDELGRVNTTYKILEENNLNYLHFYKDNSSDFTIDLDRKTDFYDDSHVNYYGAQKFTAALSEYLVENYDLTDRRKDKTASEYWDGKYEKIKKFIADLEESKKSK